MATRGKTTGLRVKPQIDSKDLTKEFVTKFGDAIKGSRLPIQKMLKKAFALGMTKTEVSAHLNTQVEALNKIAKRSVELGKIEQRLRGKALNDETKQRLNADRQAHEKEIKNLKEEQELAGRGFKKAVAAKEGFFKKMNQGINGLTAAIPDRIGRGIEKVTTRLNSAMEGTAKVFENTMSGNINGLNDTVNKLGEKLEGFGESLKKLPLGIGGALGGVTKMAGAALLGAGALVGGLMALFEVIKGVDDKTKAYNKSLLEAGTSATDLGAKGQDLTGKLENVRKAFSSATFNRQWGTLAEDHYKILNAFNESGMAVKEFTKGITDSAKEMKVYQTISAAALRTSKLFGMDGAEAAKDMATYMENLNLSLTEVSDQMQMVGKYAKESGFSAKRFYGMILQATSGVTMYNVRLAESAEILMRVTKILGTKRGEQVHQELSKGFKDMSFQDRVKGAKLAGVGTTRKNLRTDAASQAGDAGRALKEKGISGDFAGGKFKFDLDNPEEMAKQLSKLNRKDTDFVMAKLRKTLVDKGVTGPQSSAIINQFDNTAKLSQAAESKNLAVLADAQRNLGPSGVLGQQKAMIEGLGGKLETMTGLEIQGAAAATGFNQEYIENLQTLFRAGGQQLKVLEDHKKRQDEIAAMEAGDKKTLAEEEWKKQNEAYGKEFGMMINSDKKIVRATEENGQMVAQKNAEEITTVQQAISGTSEISKEIMKSEGDKNRDLIRSVVDNTTPLSRILEQGIEEILEDIRSYVARIIGWLTGTTEDEKKQRDVVILQAEKEAEAAREDEKKINAEISKMQKERDDLKKEGKSTKELDDLIKLAEEDANLARGRSAAATSKAQSAGTLSGDKLMDKYLSAVSGGTAGKQATVFAKQALDDMVKSGEIFEAAKKAGIDPEAEIKKRTDAEVESQKKNHKAFQRQQVELINKEKNPMVRDMYRKQFEQSRAGSDLLESGAGRAGVEESVRSKYGKELAVKMKLDGAREAYAPTAEEMEADKMRKKQSGTAWETELAAGENINKFEYEARGLGGDLKSGWQNLNRGANSLIPFGVGDALNEGMEYVGLFDEQKKTYEELAAEDKKLQLKNYPEAQAKVEDKYARKRADDAQIKELTGGLIGGGLSAEDAAKVAAVAVKGGAISSAMLDTLLPKTGGTVGSFLANKNVSGFGGGGFDERALPKGKSNDFLLRMDSRGKPMEVMNIDPADTLMGAKPGGALAGAASRGGSGGGGGGRTVINHFYNDGPGIFNTIRKYEDANGIA